MNLNRFIASSVKKEEVSFSCVLENMIFENADCNNDDKASVKDATCIQKYLAKLEGYGLTGEKYAISKPSVNTTDASEAPVTTPSETLPDETVLQSKPAVTDCIEDTANVPATEAETDNTTLPQITSSENIITQASETTAIHTTSVSITQTPTEPTTFTPSDTEAVVPNMVTFTNSFGWQGTISCYYWSDTDNAMTSWPGVPMKNSGVNGFGETLYTLEIPQGASYIIFINGSIQTVDIPYDGSDKKFYPVSANGEGKYTVDNW